jgi:NitT/TauT family transport system permease protein/sulfonate transport system permease protein
MPAAPGAQRRDASLFVTQAFADPAAPGFTPVRARRTRWRDSRMSGVLLVIALLCLWEASARFHIVDSVNWPPFSTVMIALVASLFDGEMLPVIFSTLWRMARGYAIGCALGVTIGFAIALYRPVRLALQPTIELLRPVPIPAIIPPLIFLLGLDDKLRLFAIAFATFFPVALNTLAGVRSIEPVYTQVARTFGVPRLTALRRVVFPAALPFILAGLRTSLGLAFVVTVIAEMIVGQAGIGYYLITMQFAMRAPEMYAGIILLTCLAYLINRAFVAWEAHAIRWARLVETMQGDTK